MKRHQGQKAWRKLCRQAGSRQGSCGGKVGYATKAEAREVVERVKLQPKFRERPNRMLTEYFCNACQLWHTGNKPVPVLAARVRGGGRRKSA